MKRIFAGFAAALVCATFATACQGQTGAVSNPTTTPPAATAAATAAATKNCFAQLHAWYQAGGHTEIQQVANDESAIAGDVGPVAQQLANGVTTALTQWEADATALRTDAASAVADPPPICGDPANFKLAMQQYEIAAQDYLAAISDISNGSYGPAVTLIAAGNKHASAANTAVLRATAAISAG